MGNLGNKEIMAKNIRHYMEKYNKTRQEMCEALGVKYTTFTDWVKGNSYPRIDKIELMANYFGISKADLVEDRNDDSSLTARDEKDIEKILDQTKQQLLSQEGLMFDGDPASPEAIESILIFLYEREHQQDRKQSYDRNCHSYRLLRDSAADT